MSGVPTLVRSLLTHAASVVDGLRFVENNAVPVNLEQGALAVRPQQLFPLWIPFLSPLLDLPHLIFWGHLSLDLAVVG
jgi:hypothetical protein